MSDPSINDIVKHNLHESTSHERDWWKKASNEARYNILRGNADFTDIATHNETATENAYQQEYKAKFNQLIKTNYDSLPESTRATITEALIDQGELPNPSVFEGIGREFVANPWSTTKEVFTECDRCDETFMDEDDFKTHKEIDHGDSLEDNDKVEETYTLTMNPDMTRESLREARKILAETKEKDLYRDAFFNYKDIKEPTVTEPDDVKGTVGYVDNPNEGLYDTKKFTTGKSTSRYGGTVSESKADEDWFDVDSSYGVKSRDELTKQNAFMNEWVNNIENDPALDKSHLDVYKLKRDDVRNELSSLG